MEREYVIYEGKKYNHYITSRGIVLGVDKNLKLEYPEVMTGIRIVNSNKRLVNDLKAVLFNKTPYLNKLIAKWDKDNWKKVEYNGFYWDVLLDAIEVFYDDSISQIAIELGKTDFFEWSIKKYKYGKYSDYYKAIYDDIDKARYYSGIKKTISERRRDIINLICCKYKFDSSILSLGAGKYYFSENENVHNFEDVFCVYKEEGDISIKKIIAKIENITEDKISEIPVHIAQRDELLNGNQVNMVNDMAEIIKKEAK